MKENGSLACWNYFHVEKERYRSTLFESNFTVFIFFVQFLLRLHFSTRLFHFLWKYQLQCLFYFLQKVSYQLLFIPFTLHRFSGTRPTDKHAICRVIVSIVDNLLRIRFNTPALSQYKGITEFSFIFSFI